MNNAEATVIDEEQLIGALLAKPAETPRVFELVAPVDLYDESTRSAYERLLNANGSGVTVGELVDYLEQHTSLDANDATLKAFELQDSEPATASDVMMLARKIRQRAKSREVVRLAERVVANPENTRAARALVEAQRQLVNGQEQAAAAVLTGDVIRALRDQKEPTSLIQGFLDPEPHLHLLVGLPKTGKTRLAEYLVVCWVMGRVPWIGAAALPGGAVLFISAEQTARRVALTLWAFGEDWEDRVGIVAPDRELDDAARALLTLDESGLAALRAVIHAGGYQLVIIDSLSRVKPRAAEENSNDDMTALLGALEAIAIEEAAHIILIHHVGHAGNSGRGGDPVKAARGASALAAVPQAVWTLRSGDQPNQRTLAAAGNAIMGGLLSFEVAPDGDPGIHYFRAIGPEPEIEPTDYLGLDETINSTQLAIRLSGSAKPSSTDRDHATEVRNRWEKRGLVEVTDGPRNSKEIRLRPPDAGVASESPRQLN